MARADVFTTRAWAIHLGPGRGLAMSSTGRPMLWESRGASILHIRERIKTLGPGRPWYEAKAMEVDVVVVVSAVEGLG